MNYSNLIMFLSSLMIWTGLIAGMIIDEHLYIAIILYAVATLSAFRMRGLFLEIVEDTIRLTKVIEAEKK